MRGTVSIYQGGKLIKKDSNAIHAGLYNYLHSRLTGNTDNSLSNLFDEFTVITDSLDAVDKDGIIFSDFPGDWYAIPTSFVTPPSIYSRRLQGIFIPEEDVFIDNLKLGYKVTILGNFETTYATFSVGENFSANIPIAIIWQIDLET